MCGIVGFVQPDHHGAVDREILERMNQTIVHRGPDDQGVYTDGPAGIAMRRLEIIDLEGGHQPIANETADVWTVFNGEIYNYKELRESLINKGHSFRTNSDTEVIVHLYEEEGEDFVKQLRGMFAIAIWDSRQRKLILCRDRVGIKPLYYWIENGLLVFGSEMKSLLAHPSVTREFSPSALSNYLSFLYIPAPQSIYKDIQKLPAGHVLSYQEGRTALYPYWDFSFVVKDQYSEDRWISEMGDAIDDAVKSHMVSDVPIGAFLSGGIDSSTVVRSMSRFSLGPVNTYSIGFEEDRFNELPFAREVAKQFGANHHEQIVKSDSIDLLPQLVAGFDEPFADSSSIPTFLVSEFARRDLKVMLSGDGGDELFGGYLWTQKEVWLNQFRKLPLFLKKQISKALLAEHYHPMREPGMWGMIQRFIYDANSTPSESIARRTMCFQPWMKEKLLRPWVLEEGGFDQSVQLSREYFDRANTKELMDRFLYVDAKVYLPDDLLVKVDRMSMLHSLEVRVPLLDHRLIEAAARVPFEFKMKGRTTKYLLKKIIAKDMPKSVMRQRKQGFSIPLQKWFQDDLHEMTRSLLLDSESKSQKFFNTRYVEWMLQTHKKGQNQFGSQIYALLMFEMWARLEGQMNHESQASLPTLKEMVS